MRRLFSTALAAILASVLAGAASSQTPSSPTLTLPKPPVAPTAPKVATPASSDSAAQLAVMRAAQDALADLRSLMQSLPESGASKPVQRSVTSNPCERAGHGSSLSCIDGIRRQLARARLPATEKSQLEADLAVLRDTLKDAQYGSPKQRTNRLAEARQRAERIDATLAKLTEPRAPATAGLPLDKLIPMLGN